MQDYVEDRDIKAGKLTQATCSLQRLGIKMEEDINRMFGKVSKSYDFVNHLLSFNIDKLWRDATAEKVLSMPGNLEILDIAAGTCDLSIALSRMANKKGRNIILHASDFNRSMLEIGSRKIAKMNLKNITTEEGNAFEIKRTDSSADAVVSGFALRSFYFSDGTGENMGRFLSETYRVLKPGGRAVLLDMALPSKPSEKMFFRIYSHFMRFVGFFVDNETYGWLVKTISKFDKGKLKSMMAEKGFKNVSITELKSGIAYIAYGEK